MRFRGGTPLHVAAGEGCRQVVELLLEQNADVQPKNSKGRGPSLKGCEVELEVKLWAVEAKPQQPWPTKEATKTSPPCFVWPLLSDARWEGTTCKAQRNTRV